MPGRRFDAYSSDEKPERPSDPAVRKANLRRIFPLFRPYRARLGAVCALIVFSAALGVIPSFLLREVLDVAIPDKDTRLLSELVAGMIAIAIVTGVIGVWQTLLSNQVGQSVITTCARRSTATSSGSPSPSSLGHARARCRAASPTTSAASRTS